MIQQVEPGIGKWSNSGEVETGGGNRYILASYD